MAVGAFGVTHATGAARSASGLPCPPIPRNYVTPYAMNCNNSSRHQNVLNYVRSMSGAAIANPAMFCRQCEQTQDHIACRTVGICGKSAETSAMQDALVHTIKSVSLWCVAARTSGATGEEMHEANWWTLRGAFSTLTNVNFDEERIAEVRGFRA